MALHRPPDQEVPPLPPSQWPTMPLKMPDEPPPLPAKAEKPARAACSAVSAATTLHPVSGHQKAAVLTAAILIS
eukprot:scaffold1041_cov93-Skeletonema_dohrnii-CCMP3373.AAC.7